MRLHTDTITLADIERATEHLPGVGVTATQHGSRIRSTAFEVKLEGNGYRANPGAGGRYEVPNGATWGEWGVFIAALYEVDSAALWGSNKRPVYDGSDHFHRSTGWRFEDTPGLLPEDTHKRHNWRNNGPRMFECTRCTATREG